MATNLTDPKDDDWSDAEEAEDLERKVAAVTEPAQLFFVAEAAFAFDLARGFDLAAIVKQRGVDFYGAVKLVNFARAEAAKGAEPREMAEKCLNSDDWQADAWLKPTLEEDELLSRLEDVLELKDEDDLEPLREELAAVRLKLTEASAAVSASLGDGAARDLAGPALGAAVDAAAGEEAALRADLEAAKARLAHVEGLAQAGK